MEVPEGCRTLKIVRTCHSGFLWAFEFLNYSGVTKNKKKLVTLENYMGTSTNKLIHRNNFAENQFVAVVKSGLKTVVRGYIQLFTPDGKGGTYDVFLIDYGKAEKVKDGDLRKLPHYASVEELSAQSWRIAIYGILPLHIEFQFGEPPSKIVGESWNGKDIIFIENVLKYYDIIEFREIKRHQEYRFGYIYLRNAKSQSVTTLQRLLVDKGYAVEVEDFDKRIPSIVKRIKSTPDHVLFPTGEEYNESNLVDALDVAKTPLSSSQESSSQSSEISSNECNGSNFINTPDAPLEADSKTAEAPPSQSSEISSNESNIAAIPTQSFISAPVPVPKPGRGRGSLLKMLQPQKAPPYQPSPMIGRLPLNTVEDQFEDSIETVYCDAVSSSRLGWSPSSSVEFLTPKNGSPSTSRRQSSSLSSSIEITGVTRARNQPEIETISLLTPPRDPSIISLTSTELPTVDLTAPPAVSLITPSPSLLNHSSSGEGTSRSTLSLSRRARGRGELLRSLSISSQSSKYSASSQDDLNERLSELKLMTTPLPGARGRGALLSQLLNVSSSTVGSPVAATAVVKLSNSSKNETTAAAEPFNRFKVDFSNELELIHLDSNTNDEESAVLSDDNEMDPQNGLIDKSITKIMVVGNEGVCRFKPKFSINDFDLHPSIKLRAGQLHLYDLRRCQRYMIGAMLTRRNVTLIDGSKTGKTVSCLIALFSLLKDDKFYKALRVGPGPRAIILCAFSSQCEIIDRQCKELNKSGDMSAVFPGKEFLRINVAYGCGKEDEKDKLRELTQGYDILITTPKCLLRLLEVPEMMNFKRLCHLVLDDAYTLYNSYRDEMNKIMDEAHENRRKCQDGLILPQLVTISKEWMPIFKSVVQNDVTEQRGVLLVGSYYEAAIFSSVTALVRRITDEDRIKQDLLNYLNVEAPKKSTVIVFNADEVKNEINETYTWLKSKCMRPIYKVSYHFGSANDIVANWKRSVDMEEYPIMCCTDNSLHDLHIHEANSLIHYNLPPQERGYFNERFSVLLNRLAGPPKFYTPGKMPLNFSKTETLIYIRHTDRKQFPAIIQFLKRLGKTIDDKLENESKQLMKERELEKDDNAFCESYKKFGRCIEKKLCKFRHYFSQKYDQPAAGIPRQGSVKIQILQVYSASHYCVRLLEHRYGSNKWNGIKSGVHPGVLNHKINKYFADHSKRSMHICKKVGEVAAIETTTNIFKRVQILERKMDDKTDDLRTVRVKFIDDGKIDDVRPSVLVKLSEELASIPPTSVDIFLCNVLPVDRDIEWSDILNNKVRERIQSMLNNKDIFFSGEIKLVAGRDVWINPLQCHKIYNKGKEIITIMPSMGKDLVKKQMAEDNPDHFSKLLSMHQSAGLLELPESAIKPIIVIENQNINEPQRNTEQAPLSNVDNRTINSYCDGSPRRSNSESLGESRNEAVKAKEPEITSVNSSNPIETFNESCSPPRTIVTSEARPSLGVNGQPNHTDDDSADYDDKSEEEWPLSDEPQTAAAPVKNHSKPNSQNDDSDSEYDLYDYETDTMAIEGLLDDNAFDCFFSPEAEEMMINQLYPEFESFKKALEGSSRPVRTVTEPKRQPLTIKEVDDTQVSRVPPIAAAPLGTNINVFKPNVEWYQDTEFVYMKIFLNVDDHTTRIDWDRIYFRAIYDERVYEFDEELFTAVDDVTSRSYKSSVTVIVKMEKLIKRNKWTRIFKSKLAKGWIKKSNEHFDEDIPIPDTYFDYKLDLGLALKEPEIPRDFTYINNYNNTNVPIYPDGYVDYLPDSDYDDDSDAVCNDNDGEE